MAQPKPDPVKPKPHPKVPEGEISTRELARQLGVDEKTLREWKKREDAPGPNDVDGWKKYIEANGLGVRASASIVQLRAEKLAVETRILKLKEKRENRQLVEVEEVRRHLAVMAAKFDQLLTQKIDGELPARVVGKDIVATRAECRAVHDEIREITATGLSNWNPA